MAQSPKLQSSSRFLSGSGTLKLRPSDSMKEQHSDSITDEELVFRAVRDQPLLFPKDDTGKVRISSMAFNDLSRRPSVDRANMCLNGPSETRDRFSLGSGVLSLKVNEIRGIKATHGITGQEYGVDIEAVPLAENHAHAEIFGRPPFDSDKVFDRIKQSLTRISTIVIAPDHLSKG